MQERFALDMSIFDESFLERTITWRMQITSCESMNKYLSYLEKEADEPQLLTDQLRNSHSEFFRNPLTFAFLEQSVIPKIFSEAVKNQVSEVRIWSAGCASGQEAFSLAMLFDDYTISRSVNVGFRIFATDLSVKAIDLAKSGLFDFKSVKNTSLELAQKYFHRRGENYLVDQKIKERIDFSLYDLLEMGSSSPPSSIYGDFDLILCCNVLFYYQPEYQQMILQKFFRSLKPGGFLITGEAETNIVSSFGAFRAHAEPAAIFVKK